MYVCMQLVVIVIVVVVVVFYQYIGCLIRMETSPS